jgi:hypothetical protein
VDHIGATYELRNIADNKKIFRHVSQLELFYYDPDSVDPMEIAAKDLKEYVVEEVLDHEPKFQASRNRKHLSFLIKWQGYGEKDNSWVQWKNLTNNSVCHAYCLKTYGLKSLVRKEYRGESDDD